MMFWLRIDFYKSGDGFYHKIFGIILAIALLTGCSDGTKTLPSNPPVAPTENRETSGGQNTNNVPVNPTTSIEPQIYWLRDEAEHLVLVPQKISTTKDTPEVILNKLFTELLNNAPETGLINTIPENTKLLDVEIKENDITLNFSPEFTQGGGGASMIGRLAQVLYTATSFSPEAKVWLRVDGKPLEVLGGEGLAIAQPITRKIFEAEFEL